MSSSTLPKERSLSRFTPAPRGIISGLLEGRESNMACENCRTLASTVLKYGNDTSNGKTVSNVMHSHCKGCGEIIGWAGQSSHKLRGPKPADEKTTVLVPQELEDFAMHRLSLMNVLHEPSDMFLRAALVACAHDMDFASESIMAASHEVLERSARAKLNIPTRGNIGIILDELKKRTKIKNLSELIRRLIVASDGPMLEAVDRELKCLALAYA
jgi:hypothetical protein